MAAPHYHVWVVSGETRRAAFMSRPFGSRAAANKWARRWVGEERCWRFVWRCELGMHCPRKPRGGQH